MSETVSFESIKLEVDNIPEVATFLSAMAFDVHWQYAIAGVDEKEQIKYKWQVMGVTFKNVSGTVSVYFGETVAKPSTSQRVKFVNPTNLGGNR